MGDISIKILGALLTVLLAFIVGTFYRGAARKITARVHNRYGPPIYQNFLDVLKLFSKKTAINHGWMQHLGPLWAITASVTTLMFVPVLKDGLFFNNLNFSGDLIFLIYMMVFGQLGMALGAGQTGNPNSAIGVSRGLSQMVGYKVPWVMGLVAVMVQYQTTSITGLLEVQSTSGTWLMFSTPFAFIAALFAFIGMMHYSPFDIVFAPQELASGPPSEFGGKYLGLMMTSGAIFAFAKLTLFVDIFLGGASNLIELLLKTFALYMIPVLYNIVSPRYRTEQAITFFWKWPLFFGVLALAYAAFKVGI